MKLLKRVNTVITAQLHEVVECFENPERMLKQTIREMEATLEKALESTARAIAGEKQLERRLADIRSKADSWQAQAQAAVKRGEETAARSALARRFELERMASALAPQLVRCQESNSRLRMQLEQLRSRLTAAKGEMGVLIARQRSAEAQREFAKSLGTVTFDRAAFDAFDELSRRVDEAEAHAAALAELRVDPSSDIPFEDDVERELQALRAECETPRE
jgi:phage shock protein A